MNHPTSDVSDNLRLDVDTYIVWSRRGHKFGSTSISGDWHSIPIIRKW